jgi:hypothetical protein
MPTLPPELAAFSQTNKKIVLRIVLRILARRPRRPAPGRQAQGCAMRFTTFRVQATSPKKFRIYVRHPIKQA